MPKFVLNLFVGRFVRRPLSRLTDMARRPAALVGAVGVTALAALLAVVLLSRTGPAALLQPDFFFGDSGAVGRMQALAGAEASMGKSGAGVKALLKRELNNQVHAREAHRYAHALQMGGLQVDPAAEKTIMTAFRRVKRGAASLDAHLPPYSIATRRFPVRFPCAPSVHLVCTHALNAWTARALGSS